MAINFNAAPNAAAAQEATEASDIRADPDFALFSQMSADQIEDWVNNTTQGDPNTKRLLRLLMKTFLIWSKEA